MPETVVRVELRSGGGAVVVADGTLQRFTTITRVARAAAILLIGTVAAALLIPIPIIHLIGIPLILLLTLVLAGRQLTLAGRLKPLRIGCPNCGAVNRVGGGLGLADPEAPRELNCDSCRRGLTLSCRPAES